MRFEWDAKKDENNLRKHGITVGQAGSRLVVVVVHAYRDTEEEEVIRLISARKATSKERKQYMNLPGGPG